MSKEIKYFVYSLVVFFFVFFSIKHYLSDENKKKTFRSLTSTEKILFILEQKLPFIATDTEDIVMYLSNDDSTNKKNYSFWNLLKREN